MAAKARALVLLALLLMALGAGAGPATAQVRSDGPLLVEVRPPDPGSLVEAGLDLWEVSPERALALVDQAQIDALRAAGRDVRVVRTFPATRRKAAAASFGAGSYRGYTAVVAELQAVAAAHPDVVTLRDLGSSWETAGGLADRHIWAARVTGPGASASRPGVLYVADYHAREVVTPELALRALHAFVDDYGRDPLLTYLVDTREIWIVPVVNPDGYARVEAGAEWWRKNADPNGASCAAPPQPGNGYAHVGVDLNRNHSFAWNTPGGASSAPCAETYQGPSPVSEPETQAIQRLIDSRSFSTLITWHSYGNLVLWPWGYKTDPSGADPVLNAIGGRLAALTGYTGGPAGSTLYLTSGELTDWAWASHGVAGVTIEVGADRDGLDGNPFTPPFRLVDRYWNENKPAVLYLARVADKLTRAFGPDAAPPRVTAPFGAAAAAIQAATPAGAGGAATTAELFLDTPGAEGAGQVGTLDPGATVATWSVSLAGLTPGRHAAWVRARDPSGRWGPLAATSFQVARQSLFLPAAPQRALVAP